MTFDGKRRPNRNYGDSPVRRSRVPIASSRLASSTRGTASRLPFGSAVESWPPQPSACPRPSPHAVPRVGDASRGGCERQNRAPPRRRPGASGGVSPLRATTTPADPRCSRRRSAGGDDGTTLFRSIISDEDGGNPANIAASGASNQTQRDARAAKKHSCAAFRSCPL